MFNYAMLLKICTNTNKNKLLIYLAHKLKELKLF